MPHDPILEDVAQLKVLVEIGRDDLKREEADRAHVRSLLNVAVGYLGVIGGGCYWLCSRTATVYGNQPQTHLAIVLAGLTAIALTISASCLASAGSSRRYIVVHPIGAILARAREDQRKLAERHGRSLDAGPGFSPSEQWRVDDAVYRNVLKAHLRQLSTAVDRNRAVNDVRHLAIGRAMDFVVIAAYLLGFQALFAFTFWAAGLVHHG